MPQSKYGRWKINFFNYLGTGFGGTITGIGCNIGIIDDPIKNDKEAFNDNVLENHYSWYTDTFLSRIEENGIQIIVMTRWSTKDLCGRILAAESDEWYVLGQKACISEEKKEMLCSEIFSFISYLKKKKLMSLPIFMANYQQEPVDVQGRLYTEFKTYTNLPMDESGNLLFTVIKNYTDTADTGDDYLCSINYGVYNNEAYILNVLYTQDGMEKTEPATAKMLYDDKVNVADVESNNGGRGFARNVESEQKSRYRSNHCVIKWFHQSKNKKARILSNSTWVMNHIYFPVNWNDRFPEYYAAMTSYQKAGRNAHDDAPDATTGIAEKISRGDLFSFD